MILCLRTVPPLPDESRIPYGARLRSQAHALRDEALTQAGFPPEPGRFAKGAHGKPYLKNGTAYFNLTHCRGLAACIVGNAECGVDAEPLGRHVPAGVMRRVCSPEEQAFLKSCGKDPDAFFRLWTLKESYVKAIGMGLAFPLREAAFLPGEEGLRFSRNGCLFRQFRMAGHLISLCVLRDNAVPQPIGMEFLETSGHRNFMLEIEF